MANSEVENSTQFARVYCADPNISFWGRGSCSALCMDGRSATKELRESILKDFEEYFDEEQ
jgi:hypothetical protein